MTMNNSNNNNNIRVDNNNPNLVNITIDNINVLVKKNTTIIQACLILRKQQNKNSDDKDIAIPRFCFHQELEIAGNCRMCLVELVNSPKPVAACAMQINDKMIIKTDTILVKKAREGVLEFFLINHPLDCPVCDQGGECDLQDQVDVFGIDKSRFNEFKRALTYKTCSPFIKMVMTRCIHCTRCIRFLIEIAGIRNFCLVGRGNQMEVGQFLSKNLKSELSGNIVDLCPVGALTSKSSAFKLRFWELTKKETVDVLDNIGADIRVDFRGTEIMRILPRLNKNVNNNWITDVTRYAFDALTIQRFVQPYFREDPKFNENLLLCKIDWANILDLYWKYIYINTIILKKKINYSFLSGTFGDNLTNLAIKHLSNNWGSSYHESKFENNKYNNVDFRQYYITNWNKMDFENTEVFVFVGLNLRLEAPLLNIKLRKLIKKKKILIFSFMSNANLLYYVKHVSTNIKHFIKFLEGKHHLSNYLINNKSNTFFLLGSSILRRKDASAFIYGLEYLKNNLLSNCSFGVIQTNIGRISGAELGLVPGVTYYQNNKSLKKKNINTFFQEALKILFIFSGDDYKNLNLNILNSFNIFVGPQSEHLINDIEMILPSTTYLEKSTSYLNVEGAARFSEIVINLLNNIQNDWRITFLLFLKLSKSLNSLKYLNNTEFGNNFFFLNYFFFIKKNNWNKELKLFFFNNNIINSLKIKLKTQNKLNLKQRYSNKPSNLKLFRVFNLIFGLKYKNISSAFINNYKILWYNKILTRKRYFFDLKLRKAWYGLNLEDNIIIFFKNKYKLWKHNYKFWLILALKFVDIFIYADAWYKIKCKYVKSLFKNAFNYYFNSLKKDLYFNIFWKKKQLIYNSVSTNNKNNLNIYHFFNYNLIINKITQYSNIFFDNKIIKDLIIINNFKLFFSILNKNVYNITYNKFNVHILNFNIFNFILIFIFSLLKFNTCQSNLQLFLLNYNIKYNNNNLFLLFINTYFNNFLENYRYTKLNNSHLYFTDNIEKTLNDKLLTYSRIFNVQNQYYILNNNNNNLLLKNKISNKCIFNNSIVTSYTDNFYKTNIISSLSPRMQASALRYKYKILFSNYL